MGNPELLYTKLKDWNHLLHKIATNEEFKLPSEHL